MTIEMTPVKSSNIKAIGTDGSKLHIQFHSGGEWQYDDAAHHHAEMLKPGVSVGGYFHAHIRGKHKGGAVE